MGGSISAALSRAGGRAEGGGGGEHGLMPRTAAGNRA